MEPKRVLGGLDPKHGEQAAGQGPMKNHNPNQEHNSKKAALGPNTKR